MGRAPTRRCTGTEFEQFRRLLIIPGFTLAIWWTKAKTERVMLRLIWPCCNWSSRGIGTMVRPNRPANNSLKLRQVALILTLEQQRRARWHQTYRDCTHCAGLQVWIHTMIYPINQYSWYEYSSYQKKSLYESIPAALQYSSYQEYWRIWRI